MLIKYILAAALPLLLLSSGARSSQGPQPSDSGWCAHLSDGIIRADEGTVEFDVTFLRPSSELLNGYEFIFRMIPDGDLGQTQRTLMGLFFPPAYHPVQGLNLIARDENTTGIAHWEGLDADVGDTVRLAFSWGDELRLYVDGELVARSSHREPLSPMPALFEVRRYSPFRVGDMRISSAQLPAERLADGAFLRNEHTTLLALAGEGEAKVYPSQWNLAESPVAAAPAWKESTQVFSASEPVYYPLQGLNHTGTARTVHIRQTVTTPGADAPLVLDHEWEMPPSVAGQPVQELFLPLPELAQPGYYRIETLISTGGGAPARAWSSAISVLPTLDGAGGELATYLGHHYEHDYPEASLAMRTAGYETLRVMENFLWFQVEPVQGHFDWTEADRVVDTLEAQGHDILGILGNPPVWAAQRPSAEVIAGHQNAAMPQRWRPRSLQEWEEYVYAVVSRYRGRVKQWEVWNEADFHPPGRPASFSGTTEEYHDLLHAAFTQIRRADPEAKVLISGFSLAPVVCDTAMPYDLLEAGAADSFDIFNIHAYNGLQFLDQIDAALAEHKPGVPRWMTEHMWHTIPNEQNRMFVSAAFPLWFMERGYDRFYTFGIDEIAFARRNRSPNPDFHVLGVLQTQLRGADSFTGRINFDGAENFSVRHGFALAGGKVLTVLGSQVASQRVVFDGDVESAIDLWGRPLLVTHSASGASVDVRNIAYIVSDGPLQVASTTELEAVPLSSNGGFEDVVGDIGMGGLQVGRPVEWSMREKDFDPQGRIGLTAEAHSGSYALEVASSGAGRVYAFQDVTIPKAGLYRLTAWVWREPSGSGIPYISFYDRGADTVYQRTLQPGAAGGWEQHSFDVRFDAIPDKQVAIIIGIAAGEPGLVRFDDVTLEPVEDLLIPRDVAMLLDIAPAATHAGTDRLASGNELPPIDLSALLELGSGASTVGRVPFTLPEGGAQDALVIVGPGSALSRDSQPIEVGQRVEQIAFLHTAMFVRAAMDERLGEYRIRYDDGSVVSIPLLNNHALRDWFLAGNPSGLEPATSVISAGGVEYGLFMTLWRNPYPQKPVRSISLHSGADAIVCLVSATAASSAQ